ncbi:hypothetical protein EZV73_19040 [Acidaminobacter sp. JC074]|uniref:hypothetical protein n=1 Tax=Acidaminobacter sp. JC074 TaxID=2530199 RepID=UPI001F0E4605|nr:hypothetical protein [Acidaminobacter sp. JC074]MCH4889686.1 hypothetical protein [Acidaminobacter sp. JC074]
MKLNDELDDSLKSKRRKAQEETELLNKLRDETEFEKNDHMALVIAALTTILPVVIIVLLAYYFISMLFFG